MSQTPTPDPSWKGLPPWLFFAVLVIGPPVPIVVFARTLTQNPFLIALLVVVYEFLLLILRFTGKIWGQLEDPLAKHIAQWATIHAQEITSRYYRNYYRHLVYEHQVFDVKGLSTRTAHDLELEQVFVDLRVNPVAAHQASADPLYASAVPEDLQGAHSIWDYLSTSTLANPHLVILGAPGSGKTTLLKHLALTLAQPRKYLRRQQMHHSFPILLFLRDYAHAITGQPDFSLAQAVQEHMQRTWQQNVPATWISRRLEKGRCLILLDGLDEVADTVTRKRVVVWVQRQMIAHGHNHFVLTSRPYGYRDNPLDGVTVLDVQAFTSEQIERFIQNWYLANELKSWGKDDPGVRRRTREGARDLMRRLQQAPALLALAVNPLLLTMIATVHRYRSSLPGRRVELYGEICEVFLGKRHEAYGIAQDLSPAQKQQVLQPLAYSLMQQGKREMDSGEVQRAIASTLALVNSQMQPASFLRHIEEKSGLLLERNPGSYGFAHLTFQEYLAAVHIKQEGFEQVLVDQVANVWWHETIRLYCAQADATALILACLAEVPPTVPALTLALECDEEKLRVQPYAQEQLTRVLATGVEDTDPERRRVIAEALLRRRIRHMVRLHDEIYIDTSLLTCAEYQLFLDEQRTQGNYYQPDHWTSFSFPAGTGHTPILGVCRSDAQAFCAWLTAHDTEQWQYRLPRDEERPPQLSNDLQERHSQTGYWVEGEQDFVWCREGSPLTFRLSRTDGMNRARVNAFDPTHVPNHSLARNLDRSLAHALDLARALDRTFDLTKSRDLARSIASFLDQASSLANSLANSLDLASALDRALASALDCNRALDHALASALDRSRDRASPRDRALASALDRSRALASALDRSRDRVFTYTLDHPPARNLDLYMTLVRLREWQAGGLPVYEGILLVKERSRRAGRRTNQRDDV